MKSSLRLDLYPVHLPNDTHLKTVDFYFFRYMQSIQLAEQQ
jgi:hypothetical protein